MVTGEPGPTRCTRLDAIKFGFTANDEHGVRRTNKDKRKSVEIALTEWDNLTNTVIAEMVGVDDSFVSDVRGAFPSNGNTPPPATRTGKDGRQYKTSKPKKATPPPSAAPPEEPEPPRVQTATEEKAKFGPPPAPKEEAKEARDKIDRLPLAHS
jgi:hypothetical protein